MGNDRYTATVTTNRRESWLEPYREYGPLGGILVIRGLWTRAAGALIALNFIAALWIAHRGDTFLNMYDALVMLAGGLFFLLHGPGRLSLDGLRERQK